MSVNHISFGSTYHGQLLRVAMQKLEDSYTDLQELHNTMIQMQDGGNSTAYIVEKFGFLDTSHADAAIAELGSCLGKIASAEAVQTFTPAQVTAAIKQLLDKFR